MSKSRTLSGLVSDGGAFSSGQITAAGIGALPISGGTLTGAITFAGAQTWPTFNQSTTGNAATATALATARTIALTGDVTYTSGSFDGTSNVTGTANLATVNSNVGSFGSGTAVPVITVNAKGLITAISTIAVTIPSGAISVTSGDLTLSGNTGTAITNATLATVNLNVGTFTKLTVNGKGLVTAASAATTTDIGEGTNLYYTDARARAAHSFTAGSGAYNSTTGVITIPTNTNQLTNGAGFITGSGNAATVTNGVYITDTGTVTNTMLAGSIANAKLTNSTISGVALGGTLNTLTLATSGTGISGSTTYNGSGAATFTVTSNATAANTGSTVVARDGGGSFSAGTITATLSGNASTATTATNVSGGTVSATTGTFSGLIKADGGTTQVGSSAGVYRQFRYDGTISADGTNFYTLLNSNNYTSYSPTLTGGSASGTWGISVTGTATTASNISGGNQTGSYEVTSGQYTRFGHASQSDVNDGKIGAALFGTGLNIVGTQTSAGTGRQIRLWGSVITDAGSVFLHSGNYTSYSPTLTGGSASGTWGIRVTGFANAGSPRLYSTDTSYNYDAVNPYYGYLSYDGTRWLFQVSPGTPAAVRVAYADTAGSATSATSATSSTYLNSGNYILRSGSSGSTSANFQATPAGSKRYQGDDANLSDSPGATWWHYEHMRHSNASNYWGTTVAWGWEDNANKLAVRNVSANSFGGWVYYLNSSNYNSYSPTLTGGSASGTWGISITGNAAGSATSLASNNNTSYFGKLIPYGIGGDSGQGNDGYAIYQQGGAWSHPYPDLAIGYHTGIKIGAYLGYNGVRIYNNSDFATITASFHDGDNNFRSYYDVIAYASDKRLKENILNIPNALQKVLQLNGVTFDWKQQVKDLGFEPSSWHECGVLAQDVEAVLPEAVEIAPFDYDWKAKDGSKSKSGQKYLTVKYEKLVPLLIEAIKEQQSQIDQLMNLVKAISK